MERIHAQFRVSKVVALLGPRQAGKTTVARRFTEVSGLPFDGGLEKIAELFQELVG